MFGFLIFLCGEWSTILLLKILPIALSNSNAECNFSFYSIQKIENFEKYEIGGAESRVVVLPNSESLSKQFENPFCLNMKVDK